MQLRTRPDVAVVGGGVIGLTIAWRAARAGLGRIAVLDPEIEADAPDQASWAAAGMLAPVTEVHYGEEPLLALTMASAARWPVHAAELADATGTQPAGFGYRESGTLSIARDADDMAALDDLAAYQDKLGLRVQRLRGRECRALEPALAPATRGGLLVEGDHQVDNRALVLALREACRRAGVALLAERVQQLADVDAGVVVLAAGAASGELAPELPVRAVKGQLLHLRGPEPLAGRNLRGVEVYLVPRADGRLAVGATVEERGDTTVTARGVHDLLRAAIELLPDVGELELVGATAGRRPGTPDNAPLLGWHDQRTLVATGHYRNGVLLSPVTADLAVQLLTGGGGGAVPEQARAFDPGRFARGAP